MGNGLGGKERGEEEGAFSGAWTGKRLESQAHGTVQGTYLPRPLSCARPSCLPSACSCGDGALRGEQLSNGWGVRGSSCGGWLCGASKLVLTGVARRRYGVVSPVGGPQLSNSLPFHSLFLCLARFLGFEWMDCPRLNALFALDREEGGRAILRTFNPQIATASTLRGGLQS